MSKSADALWNERYTALLEKLNRLEIRKKEGWGYRRVLRKAHSVSAYKVRAHYAMLPVKRR